MREEIQKILDFDDNLEMHRYKELSDFASQIYQASGDLHKIFLRSKMADLMSEFGERETDIYIITFPRSGTTMMQMMLYQMTTSGEMDFKHIYDVSPWPLYCARINGELKSVGERRILKSHDAYAFLSHLKKPKFILVYRNGLDSVLSLYHQQKDYGNKHVELNEMFEKAVEKWAKYNAAWIENKNRLDVLALKYEDIIKDKEKVIKEIASFANIDLSDEIINRTMERSSFSFMKEHQSKFGEQPNQEPIIYDNFIRKGMVGEGKGVFTKEQITFYEKTVDQFLNKNTF